MFRHFQVPETPIWLLSKGRQKAALKSLCKLRGWAKPEDVKEEFDQLLQYNEVLQQCVICAKVGKNTQSCEHTNATMFKRFKLRVKHILLAKETLRPFTLVMAYFLFYTMSGLASVKPNMVNVCRALGMMYDAKTIVVSGWLKNKPNFFLLMDLQLPGRGAFLLYFLSIYECKIFTFQDAPKGPG